MLYSNVPESRGSHTSFSSDPLGSPAHASQAQQTPNQTQSGSSLRLFFSGCIILAKRTGTHLPGSIPNFCLTEVPLTTPPCYLLTLYSPLYSHSHCCLVQALFSFTRIMKNLLPSHHPLVLSMPIHLKLYSHRDLSKMIPDHVIAPHKNILWFKSIYII